jgi:hypothetical protein
MCLACISFAFGYELVEELVIGKTVPMDPFDPAEWQAFILSYSYLEDIVNGFY